MKKLVLAAAALALFTAPAYAGISGTGHAKAGCLGCHLPHGSVATIQNATGPFLARSIDTATTINGMCFACHDNTGTATYGSVAIGVFGSLLDEGAYTDRSTGVTKTDHPVGALLTVDAQPAAGVYCTSCHDAHNTFNAPNALLLSATTAGMNAVCSACHTSK